MEKVTNGEGKSYQKKLNSVIGKKIYIQEFQHITGTQSSLMLIEIKKRAVILAGQVEHGTR